MENKLKIWHIYLVKIPYYSPATKNFAYKVRLAIFYSSANKDATFLPLTSNENPNGSIKKEANKFQVAVKYGRHGLVKVNQPICISIDAIVKLDNPIQVSTNDRSKIIKAWNKLMVWPNNK